MNKTINTEELAELLKSNSISKLSLDESASNMLVFILSNGQRLVMESEDHFIGNGMYLPLFQITLEEKKEGI